MRPPRPRFTLRWLMVAVATLAVILGAFTWATERQRRFTRLYYFYVEQERQRTTLILPPPPKGQPTTRLTPKGRWSHDQAAKYSLAARYPWLPVSPDPPEPQ